MSSISPLPSRKIDQRADDRDDVVAAQHAHGVGRVKIEPHVHLHAADRRKIVALGIEEQRTEHRLGRLYRRRLARPHHAVDIEQRVLARHVLVDRERIADVGADIHVIDVEQRQFLVAGLDQDLEVLLGDFLAGLHVDFAGAAIGQILGNVVADQFVIGHAQGLEALLGELARLTHGELLAGLDHDTAGVGIDEIVDRLVALQPVGIERHAPAIFGALVHDVFVEGREDLLAIETERIEQRRHRNFAAAIDARIDDVLGVELDVEPGTAVRNDAGGKQELARRMGLALVVIEEDARRAVHLRNDDALGAVDDEGAVIGHERNVAHVDILLLDVLDRTRARLFIDIEHDQPQRHLERRGIGHAALAALVDVIFRRLEFVLDEFELGRIGKIGNRKYRFENGLKPLVGTAAHRLLHQQELVVGCLLNLDEVRHLRHFLNCPEKLPYALATGKRLRHLFSLDSISAGGAGASPNSRIPSRPSGQASGPSGSMRFGPGPNRRTLHFHRDR